MEKLDTIKKQLARIQSEEGPGFESDTEAILNFYQNPTEENSSLAIKLLSVFGGILASFAVFGFMFTFGVFDSEWGALIIGILSIAVAWAINKKVDKLIFDTFSVSLFVIGVVSFSIGLLIAEFDENLVLLIVILIAFAGLYVMQNYVLSFISCITIGTCFLILIVSNDLYNLIHLYIGFCAFFLTYWFLYEPELISKGVKLLRLYAPIRTGLVISFLLGLIVMGWTDAFKLNQNYLWISSVFILSVVFYVVRRIMTVVQIQEIKHQRNLYVLVVLFLLPTVFSPSISGAILIILLGFLVNYKTGFVIGLVSLVYFISQYYYDLNLTLLTKSIILISSGAVLLALYFFIQKQLQKNEKV